MIWQIVKKEFLLSLMTFKFAVGVIVCLVLTAVFVPILARDYEQRLRTYHENVAWDEAALRNVKVYRNIRPTVFRAPAVLSVVSEGLDKRIDASATIALGQVPRMRGAAAQGNPYQSIFPVFDASLVFRIVISVLALLVASRQVWDNADQYGERAGTMSHDRNFPGNNPPARARLRTAATKARNRVLEDHHDRMLAQVFAGRNFTSFSPAVLYQRVAEAVAGTGIHHCVSVYRQIRQYQTDLKQYVHSVDREDPNSLHLIFEEEGCARSWQAISHKPVDFEAVPKFQEREPSLGEFVRPAAWDIGLLGLFNAVFFATAWVSFMRYDVR